MENCTIDYLWNASEKCSEMPSAMSASDAIRTHLRLRCIEDHKTNSYNLPKTTFGANRICAGCHCSWSEGRYRLRLIAEQPPKRRTILLARKDPSKLNKYQRKLRELCMRPRKNVLELECLVCRKVTRMGMDKPKVREEDRPPPVEESPAPKKKPKKRKRDSFAGLIASAVQSAQDELGSSGGSSAIKRKKMKNEFSGDSAMNRTIEELNGSRPTPTETPKKGKRDSFAGLVASAVQSAQDELGSSGGLSAIKRKKMKKELSGDSAMNRTIGELVGGRPTPNKTLKKPKPESPAVLHLMANINSNVWTDDVDISIGSPAEGDSARKKRRNKKRKKSMPIQNKNQRR